MNEWSRNRKRLIFVIALFAVVLLIALPGFLIFYRAPSCFDKRLNGDETGVDCGGSCELLCRAESLPILLKGDPRIIEVTPNTYEVVAIVENPNSTGEIQHAGYTIKIYNATSTNPIKIIDGVTYVPRGATFAIFERPFSIEASQPKRATLEWKKETLAWQKNTKAEAPLKAINTQVSRTDSKPRLDATVENLSHESISNVELVAVLSGADGNIFAVSSTFLDRINANEETPIVFTWPLPFDKEVVDTHVYIRAFPDRSFIR